VAPEVTYRDWIIYCVILGAVVGVADLFVDGWPTALYVFGAITGVCLGLIFLFFMPMMRLMDWRQGKRSRPDPFADLAASLRQPGFGNTPARRRSDRSASDEQ
jgi:hypothetical protein